MEKVLLVSKNKRIIEKITPVFNTSILSEFCLLSLSRYEYIGDDINEFGANIIVVDMTEEKQAVEVQLLYELLAYKKEIKYVVLVDDKQTEWEKLEGLPNGCVEYMKITEDIFDKLSRQV